MGDMTPEQRAEDVLSTFRRNAQSASIKAIIATAIRDAEERGRLAERERCATLCAELRHPSGYSSESDDWVEATLHCAAAIRAGDERESER